MADEQADLDWFKVAEIDELAGGRVKSVAAGGRYIALVHFDGQYAAMDNHCPHQGGPLGEGSIESGSDGRCWLRCPWHGWDFDPLTGKPPGGHEDSGQETFPVKVREDGVYVGVAPQAPRARTVSDVMAETMTQWGVRSVFGMVGHSNLGLAEAFRVLEDKNALSYYAIRHEGAASFACSGYAKLTGKPAACFSIAGPGATNLLTGLWDAKMDRAPVLALTGQVQVQVFGPGAFQDIPLDAAFDAVARFSKTVLPNSNHAELMSLACKSAIVERDVAHLIFPDDVTKSASDAKPKGPQGRLARIDTAPSQEALDEAAAMVAEAKRPLIIVGYGAREAMDEISALAEALNCPVATTFKAKGQIPDTHPLAAGVLGRSGTPIASWFMNECDLILALGSSFSNHTGITPSKPIIQVEFDPMQIGKFHPVTLPLLGEVGRSVDLLRGALQAKALSGADQRDEIAERWSIWRDEKARRLAEDRGKGLSASVVFDALTRLAPSDAVIAVDVGNNAYSFGRYFEPCGQSVLLSGYLGSIGFAFPAAMGAWAATKDVEQHKDRKVIAVAGDGGFAQYAMEFTTALRHGMSITLILLNNEELGKISKEQRGEELPVYQTSLVNPSFAAFAEECGGWGRRVTNRADLDAAMAEALAQPGPAILEIMQDAELV
jgi:thiamine pyrophosphate-dependent acetolactate synthase large subunit-like protein/nitrite reductase/ring-hydroxylating ferredoxin subunit